MQEELEKQKEDIQAEDLNQKPEPETLDKLEPAAGDSEQSRAQNNGYTIEQTDKLVITDLSDQEEQDNNARNVQDYQSPDANLELIDLTGALDGEEDESGNDFSPLDSSQGQDDTNNFIANVLQSARRTTQRLFRVAEDEVVEPGDVTSVEVEPAPEPYVFDPTILVSNRTDNQRFINDDNSYELALTRLKAFVNVDGNDMDISGVSNSAAITYQYVSETKFQATLKSGWNSVKNFSVESDDLQTVIVKNFVHVDALLTNEDGASIKIVDAKRGFIETADGDDHVTVAALTNGGGWSNTFDIDTGAGDDRISVKGDDNHTDIIIDAGTGDDHVQVNYQFDELTVQLGEGDDYLRAKTTNGDAEIEIDAGIGHDRVETTDNYKFGNVDLGVGDDWFKGGHGVDTVYGREGDDEIFSGRGDDLLYAGAGNDTIRGGHNNDQIIGGEGDDEIKGDQHTDIAVYRGSLDEYIITDLGRGQYRIEDTVEGRDGTDTLIQMEAVLFGVDDLYEEIQGWSDAERFQEFGERAVEDIDILELISGYDALQDAIDGFVSATDNRSAPNEIAVDNTVPELVIHNLDDIPLSSDAII